MDVSVTDFKQHCLDIIRRVEKTGRPVTIRRRGRIVARLHAPPATDAGNPKPWEDLRALGGRLRGPAEDSVLRDEDFEALR